MSKTDELTKISKIISDAQKIVIIQADNPDGDSVSSALALEEILSDQGKQVFMYCGVDIPTYLRYLPGWDRISRDLPNDFDASVIVDAGNELLFEQLDITKQKGPLKTRPSILIDHHASDSDLSWISTAYCQNTISTTQLIYDLSKHFKWPLNPNAKELIVVGILSDSLGLTTESTSAHSLRTVADLVDGGVSLAKLENARRSTMNRSPQLVHYKGQLLQRVEYHENDRVATLTIPWEEIETYSPLYNPSMLAIDDMRLTTNTAVAICFKLYPDGKITGKIRCNWGFPIGDKLAECFGGGGHPYASGFKLTNRKIDELKNEVIAKASQLLEDLK